MYTVVIVEDDPMITELNRRYAERDGRFTVAQTFGPAPPGAGLAAPQRRRSDHSGFLYASDERAGIFAFHPCSRY